PPPVPNNPSAAPLCSTRIAPGRLVGSARTIQDFISAVLVRFVQDRTIVDRTGLFGSYDFSLEWTPDTRPVVSPEHFPPVLPFPPGPSVGGGRLFTALQEQLGLKLEPGGGPVDVLLIEHVERPTPD